MTRDLVAWLVRIICGVRPLPAASLSPAPTIYFANHSSHLDFVAIWAALPATLRARTRPVAGRDYWEKTPRRSRIARNFFNAVLIERQHVTVASNPLAPMLAALEAGDSLIVFPEGTRSADGSIHEFKSGLYYLARAHPGIALVPVYLQNLSRILPKGEILPVPLLGSLAIGNPLTLDSGEPKGEFLRRARAAVLQLATC